MWSRINERRKKMRKLLSVMAIIAICLLHTGCVQTEPVEAEPEEVFETDTPEIREDIPEDIMDNTKATIEIIQPLLDENGIVLDWNLIGVDDVKSPQYSFIASEHTISPTVDEWINGYYIGVFIIYWPWPPYPPFPWPPFPWPWPLPWPPPPWPDPLQEYLDFGIPILLQVSYEGKAVEDISQMATDEWMMDIINYDGEVLATIPVEYDAMEHSELVTLSWLPKKFIIHLNFLGSIGWDVEK